MKAVGEKFDVFDTERATDQRRPGTVPIFAYSGAAGPDTASLDLAHNSRARPLAMEWVFDELPTDDYEDLSM